MTRCFPAEWDINKVQDYKGKFSKIEMIWLDGRNNKDDRSKKEQETWCGETNEFSMSGLHSIYWVVMGASWKDRRPGYEQS